MFKVKRRELFKQALSITTPVTLQQVLGTLEISLDEYLTMSHQEYIDTLFSYVHNRQGYVAS